MNIGEYVVGYSYEGINELVTPYEYSQGKTIDIVNESLDGLRAQIQPYLRIRIFRATITEVFDGCLQESGPFLVTPSLYTQSGLLIVRNGGMVFVGDDKAKAYKIEPHDTITILNKLLIPLGYSFDSRDKFVLNATAAVFEDRAIIRSINDPEIQK